MSESCPSPFGGAGPSVCHTALDSAKQNPVYGVCYEALQRTPCKGGVTNIRACTCVHPASRIPHPERVDTSTFLLASSLRVSHVFQVLLELSSDALTLFLSLRPSNPAIKELKTDASCRVSIAKSREKLKEKKRKPLQPLDSNVPAKKRLSKPAKAIARLQPPPPQPDPSIRVPTPSCYTSPTSSTST